MTESSDPSYAQRERRVLELFDRAVDLSRADRSDWLDRECRGDAEVRGRVEELIAAAEEPDSALDGQVGLRRNPDVDPASASPLAALLAARDEFAAVLDAESTRELPVSEPNRLAEPGASIPSRDEIKRRLSDDERYVTGDEIARGGMGIIHRVWDSLLRRSIARKVNRLEKSRVS
ncbi:MAG: hypothetical protein AAF517_04665, partial [Planctomycetota bacterium]